MDINILRDFFSAIINCLNSNFFASLIGGFLANYFFFIILQKKVQDLIDYKEKKKLSENFYGELIYNKIIACKNIENTDKYKKSAEMNVVKYDTYNIDEFIKRKPLDLTDDFYKLLQVFSSAGLKKNNMLLEIFWFGTKLNDQDVELAKKNYLDNAHYVQTNIDKILKDKKFIAEITKLNIII